VLPTKGLTLPLMSYGRSSLIVSLAWVGLLLRVYHEAMLEKRGSATVRQRSSVLGDRQARAARSSARAPTPAAGPEPPPKQADLLDEHEDRGEEE
jgi:cell division protein FtsW